MLIVATGSKIGTRNFAAFRAQADRCFLHAQMSDDHDTRQRWLSLGATWLEFADRINAKWPMTVSSPLNVGDAKETQTWH
jgi:hypothetical protein